MRGVVVLALVVQVPARRRVGHLVRVLGPEAQLRLVPAPRRPQREAHHGREHRAQDYARRRVRRQPRGRVVAGESRRALRRRLRGRGAWRCRTAECSEGIHRVCVAYLLVSCGVAWTGRRIVVKCGIVAVLRRRGSKRQCKTRT